MRRFLRSTAVVAGLGSTILGFMPMGCSNRLGPVVATQEGGIDRPSLPDIFVEKAKECVAEHGAQLEGQHYRLDSKIDIDEDGSKQKVTIAGIPDTAPDFGACMRIALQDMPIADEPFREGVKLLKYRRQEATTAQRALVGHPVVIVVAGVTIIVSEVALEAGAVTILFAVSVKVVEKAAKDVAEDGWKAVCVAKYTACVAAVGTRKRGNHPGISRCASCLETCTKEQSWPASIGNGSCEFWKRNWR